MQNTKNPATVLYMVRQLLTANITDPLAQSSRGIADYEQWFSGTGNASQINYLERKPVSGGKFLVYYAGTLMVLNTDYTYDSANLLITWTGTTPASGSDNIDIQYSAVKPWIYDDNPNLSTAAFPRITVQELETPNQPSGLGGYIGYSSAPGDYIKARFSIIVRQKRGTQAYVYAGIHVKNYDLVLAISEAIETYFNTHRVPPTWQFQDWAVIRKDRIYSEEETADVMQRLIVVDVKYYRNLYPNVG